MNIARIYYPYDFKNNEEVILNKKINHYLTHVLRIKHNSQIQLFNGKNIIFPAQILSLDYKKIQIKILTVKEQNSESPLYLHLGQVISCSEKMKFSLQKAVELGVNVITPLFSKRCKVKLTNLEMIKKKKHWKKIVIAACEQCGINYIPKIRDLMTLESWCKETTSSFKIHFCQNEKTIKIKMLPFNIKRLRILIGPESGISQDEKKYGKS
ncbi:MAG: 16S rRNA (uracil(1498)-N(3))-methyltransferase [Candidatus Dasytiphilus stammeri]